MQQSGGLLLAAIELAATQLFSLVTARENANESLSAQTALHEEIQTGILNHIKKSRLPVRRRLHVS
jgi:hypothetical protein